MASTSISSGNTCNSIVKEGWLLKRGEHYRNWRPRYFMLFIDGTLLGFRNQPERNQYRDPLNNFTVKGCQIMTVDKPKPFSFLIRGLQRKTVIERIFSVETDKDREEWVTAIQQISSQIESSAGMSDMENSDVEMFIEQGMEVDIPAKRKVTLDKFEFMKVLGKGTLGKVVLSRDKDSGKLYAIKILKKQIIIQKDQIAHTMAENRVLKTTNHPFLTALRYSFHTADRVCFVMEYVNGGDLFFHMKNERLFSEERTKFYGAEIVTALGYLHSQGIIYRDLKLENVLLDKDGHIKIADFGLCKLDITYGRTTKTFCGTPEYLAPELVADVVEYSTAVDWWGLGVVMYEMLCGRLPFYNENHEILYGLIRREEVRYPRTLSIPAKSLLAALLNKDPSKRLGGGPQDAEEVKAHPFFCSINWTDLVTKRIPPPFIPQVTSEIDTKYFDTIFTGESVILTPERGKVLANIKEEEFSRFSYQDSCSCSSTINSFTYNSLQSVSN